MSTTHIHKGQSMASMLNQEPEPMATYEFSCKVCGDSVFTGQATDMGLTIGTCRDCTSQRIAQLVCAEQELKRLKKQMKTALTAIALKAEHEANGLEAA